MTASSDSPETPVWLRPRDGADPERALRDLAADLTELNGVGQSEDGWATAQVDHAGVLVGLDLDPRVLALGTGEVARRVLAAAQGAAADLQARMRGLLVATYGEEAVLGDPLAAADAAVDHLAGVASGLQKSFDEILAEVERISGAGD